MNIELKKGNKISFRELGLSRLTLLISFFGLFAINLIWLILFSTFNQKYLALFAAIISSLLIGSFLIYKNQKSLEKIESFQKEIENFYCKKVEENERLRIREEELEKANQKLRKTNQEYLETTKKLFERENELKKANQRLQEIDNVKSEFVSVAAHQLRTPLTGIKWSYQTLLDKETGSLNKFQKEIVEKGLETIDYAISVINDLLNTARIEEGKSGFNFSVQPLGPIIQEIINQHKAVIEEKKIDFTVDFSLASSFSFRFDKEKLSIVFDNILANAVKYTLPGGKISLKSFRTEDQIQFKITDTGIGIPQKDLDKVFTKFFRSKNAVSFQTSGSGLGLYVAKNIVEKHGGTIELESEENKGTTITITLPIAPKTEFEK